MQHKTSYSMLDKLILQCDLMLRNSKKQLADAKVASPALRYAQEYHYDTLAKKQTIAMMRVNHSGEVCAQALYYGQALMAKTPQQYVALMTAATEENDHLLWCKGRLTDLHGRTSLLNPFWFAGSFSIGVLAGIGGDAISLGFIVETEHQVTAHLERHLTQLNSQDLKTRAVLLQMRADEQKHASVAAQSGAHELPWFIKKIMTITGTIMTKTAAKF